MFDLRAEPPTMVRLGIRFKILPTSGAPTLAKIYVISCGGRTGPGGMPRMVDYYMTEWEVNRRKPPLAVIDSTGPAYDWRRQPFSEVWSQPLYCLRGLVQLAAAGVSGRAAGLHVHMADRGSVFRKGLFIYLGRMLHLPVVIHMHAATFKEFYTSLSPLLQRCVRNVLGQGHRVIVLGNLQRQYFIDTVKLNPASVIVMHNAVPPPPSLATPPEDPQCQLLFVGTLIERKGLRDLLHALAQPNVRSLPWHMRIVGEGDQSRWASLVEAHGLNDRVDFVGWLPSSSVYRFLEGSDILVLPSLNEGLPVVILEAMAHGRPVIVTPVGSVCDVVENEVTGLIIPRSCPAALSHALARLIANRDLRSKLGLAGRQVILERFTISRLNDQLEKMFGQLMGEAGGTGQADRA
jgi:glycosyltransferase involved in cell wall biosynthesis